MTDEELKSRDFKISKPSTDIGIVTKDNVFILNWKGGTIRMSDIEEAKTVALVLFRLIFEKLPSPK